MTTPADDDTSLAWAATVQTALLGSARTRAPRVDAPPQLATLLAALDTTEPPDAPDSAAAERRLLRRAAVLSTYVRAGRLPERLTVPPDDSSPLDADDAPVSSAGATTLLSRMLVGEHREVLSEWLARTAERGWRAPATALPSLLDIARGAPPLRAGVIAVLGARGRWLAARNPDWAWAAADVSAESARARWETGAPNERAAALAELRRLEAADARALLEATWASENAAGRATLLAALRTSLGPGDEPFLERALDDRARDVRAAAVDLLASLPGSALVARMTARARAALHYEPGRLLRRARIVVTLPGAPDSEAVRDGVQPNPPHGVGERAWWLAQIVGAVPPRAWTDSWRVDAVRAVELAREGEWSEPLVDGWARAASRHGDAAWAEALLRAGALVDRHARVSPGRAALLGTLPDDRRAALLDDALAGRAPLDPVELIAASAERLRERAGRSALAWLKRRAADAAARPDARPADDWLVVELLATLATRLPPALAADALDGWPAELPLPWTRALERFASVLTFRRTLDAAFTARRP